MRKLVKTSAKSQIYHDELGDYELLEISLSPPNIESRKDDSGGREGGRE